MDDAVDAADQIREAAEEEEKAQRAAETRFRRRAAVTIGVLAMCLAIASLGGDNATKNQVNANIQASDTWAFYQAKNVRQTQYRLALDAIQVRLQTEPTLTPEQRSALEAEAAKYQDTINRYDSDPSTGEGMKELMATAQAFEAQRTHAGLQDPNFDYAQAFFQIAIVLGSVSIVAGSRWLLWLSLGLGAIATLLTVNGFALLVNLPIG
jgi:hypothetical protein